MVPCRSMLLATLLSLTASLAVGCGEPITRAPLHYPPTTSITITPALQLEDVRKEIMLGCLDAGWTPYEAGPNAIGARFTAQDGRAAAIEILYTAQEFSFIFKHSTADMLHQMEHNDVQVIDPAYNAWISRLETALNKRLATKS